jgi:colicin import membrane protein
MTDATPYTVPREPGRWRALTFAALVHAALFAFLWIGVRWQNDTPATIEAEVWSPQPREAAPLPEPVKAPEPLPQPVIKDTPKPKAIEPPVVKPDIALEQEKKRKAQEKKQLDEEKLAKLKQEELKALQKEKADKAKKDAAEKKLKQDEADSKLLAKIRQEDMKRMAGGVTGTGGTGDAEKSQGGRADAGYGQRIAVRIKSHTVFNVPDGLADNPPVEYAIDLLPDGSLRGVPRKLKSSNIPGFDEAVLRAIDKSQPFPRDEKTGNVPSRITVSHRPKDQ